jgi:hypothetical protein
MPQHDGGSFGYMRSGADRRGCCVYSTTALVYATRYTVNPLTWLADRRSDICYRNFPDGSIVALFRANELQPEPHHPSLPSILPIPYKLHAYIATRSYSDNTGSGLNCYDLHLDPNYRYMSILYPSTQGTPPSSLLPKH